MSGIIRTTALLAILGALFVSIGYVVGGASGATFALVFAFIFNFASYWFSDRVVLAMYRARPIEKSEKPWLHEVVGKLARSAKIPMPKIYIVESANPNAFATGRNPKNAAVAVTTGILELLGREELEGVIAHELGHIKNRDILIGTIAATIAAAISWIAEMLMWNSFFGGDESEINPVLLIPIIILAPLAAALIQLAISRSREYVADETGAKLSKNPKALASALHKISVGSDHYPMKGGSQATAHMFIANPFKQGMMARLFSTHPPMDERIRRLNAMKSYAKS